VFFYNTNKGKEREELFMKCSKCGAEIPEGAKFCTECGTKISEEAAVHETPPVQQGAE